MNMGKDHMGFPLFTVSQMSTADAYTIEQGTDAVTLMGRAAYGAYQVIRALQGREWDSVLTSANGRRPECILSEKPKILIAAGGGNNGGDGWALACELQKRGYSVRVISFSEKATPVSTHYINEAIRLGVPYSGYQEPADMYGADLIVDCLLGTGFRGEPAGSILDGILSVRKSGLPVLAMDINSGMNGDTGTCFVRNGIPLCTDSLVTMTIGLWKKGLVTPEAQTHIQHLVLCDIGIIMPPEMIPN